MKIKQYIIGTIAVISLVLGSSLIFSSPASAVTEAECRAAGGTWIPVSGANPYNPYCNYPTNSTPGNTGEKTPTEGSGTGSKCEARSILTFPVWYRGVVDDACNVSFEKPTDFWIVAINVIEILLQLAGYLAAIYIIMGGFKYLTSAGSPEAISSAGNTIRNASIGLIIALAAVAIVRFIARSIT